MKKIFINTNRCSILWKCIPPSIYQKLFLHFVNCKFWVFGTLYVSYKSSELWHYYIPTPAWTWVFQTLEMKIHRVTIHSVSAVGGIHHFLWKHLSFLPYLLSFSFQKHCNNIWEGKTSLSLFYDTITLWCSVFRRIMLSCLNGSSI